MQGRGCEWLDGEFRAPFELLSLYRLHHAAYANSISLSPGVLHPGRCPRPHEMSPRLTDPQATITQGRRLTMTAFKSSPADHHSETVYKPYNHQARVTSPQATIVRETSQPSPVGLPVPPIIRTSRWPQHRGPTTARPVLKSLRFA